ncbi:MAG: TetR family transcriptional regulator [Propionibacterium sp.]|nr:MAG: TetR family transcriptional regulator [Propionibacterium sp.]
MSQQRDGKQPSGRRLRKWQAMRATITEAARAAFFDKPFDTVTVQQIADQADVAVGTLFYHASSKAELFFLVFNTVLEQAITEGEAAEAALPVGADVTDRIAVLVAPIEGLRHGKHAANMTRYHRELLFSDSTGAHRLAGIELVRRLETRIAQILCEAHGVDPDNEAGWFAARAIFAALHFDIASPPAAVDPQSGAGRPGDSGLATQIAILVAGFAAFAAAEAGTSRDPDASRFEEPTTSTLIPTTQ